MQSIWTEVKSRLSRDSSSSSSESSRDSPPYQPLFSIQLHPQTPEVQPRLSVYEPLPSKTSIRLAKILPGTGPISITLEVVDLHQKGSRHIYDAVSYVWGGEKRTTKKQKKGKRTYTIEDPNELYELVNARSSRMRYSILVNGTPFSVRMNLMHALSSIRKPGEASRVWIDALCINQEDPSERSSQVLLMPEIYGKAARTLICLDLPDKWYRERTARFEAFLNDKPNKKWPDLGTAVLEFKQQRDPWTSLVTATINRLAEFCKIDGWTVEAFSRAWRDDIPLPRLTQKEKESLQKLFSCRWFGRIWVIQEIILSRNATILLGDEEFEWELLGVVAARIIHDRAESIESLPGLHQAAHMWRGGHENKVGGVFPLEQLLEHFQSAEATDPRDHIYALLGLSMENEILQSTSKTKPRLLPPVPNYEESLRDVFCAWTRYFIKESGSLDVFSHTLMAGVGKPYRVSSWSPHCDNNGNPDEKPWTQEEAGFPSWVPHWNRFRCPNLNPEQTDRPHRASLDLPVQLASTDDPYRLKVRGLLYDKVSWIGKVIMQDDWPYALFKNWLDVSEYFERLKKPYPTGEAFDDVFATTAAAGAIQKREGHGNCGPGDAMTKHWATVIHKNPLDYSNGFLESIPSHLKTVRDGTGWDVSHEKHVISKCQNRKFFLTEKGYLGLGHSGIKVKDQVCILFGGNTPFVMRRRKNHFVLVGQCYVQGVMQGEVIENWKAGGRLEDQWFDIR